MSTYLRDLGDIQAAMFRNLEKGQERVLKEVAAFVYKEFAGYYVGLAIYYAARYAR